jgi:hypothetical protein
MESTVQLTPQEAQKLLDSAEQLSAQTHEATKWPYVAFLLGLGAVTSFGTLGMSLLDGTEFGLAYVGTLLGGFALLMFFVISTQERRGFAWSARWKTYMGAWATAYVAAIAVVGFAHGSVVWAAVTSGLVFLVTFVSAMVEVKR